MYIQMMKSQCDATLVLAIRNCFGPIQKSNPALAFAMGRRGVAKRQLSPAADPYEWERPEGLGPGCN